MELIEGEDLSEHIARGPIPIAEALPIARQIAEALEAAHEQGIVHRDLKPGNIKVTPDARVKVLDFGLAKAMDATSPSSPNVSHSPTLTHQGTMAGMIIGTAAYMSPEQARGKAVGKRADIWSFGVVLFEMLSGRRLFAGETVSDTLAAVLKTDPDWTLLPRSTPAGVTGLLRRCLDRDPKLRLRDIGEARFHLEPSALRASSSAPVAKPAAAPAAVAGLPWLLSAGLALALLVVWSTRAPTRPLAGPFRQFAIDLAWQTVPNWNDFDVALSRDGSKVAYYGRHDNDVEVYVRSLDSLTATPLAEARQADAVEFSPDGEWLSSWIEEGLDPRRPGSNPLQGRRAFRRRAELGRRRQHSHGRSGRPPSDFGFGGGGGAPDARRCLGRRDGSLESLLPSRRAACADVRLSP